jgi:tRNA (mo5U34)-methyltransferase
VPELGILSGDRVIPVIYQQHPRRQALERFALARVADHGDYPRWRAALDALPDIRPESVAFGDRVSANGSVNNAVRRQLIDALKALHPWRKGPFELFGVHLDTEWRSDWKWQRIAAALGSLHGQTVLDVGCGNGYFGWRALAAGAREVVGVDPSVLFYLQHQAICNYLNQLGPWSNFLLPVTFEQLPEAEFDLVLSMGVLYHRRDPVEHIEQLTRFTRPGGRLLVESLVVEQAGGLVPIGASGKPSRYSRMRNISIIPSIDMICQWLSDAGLKEVSVVTAMPTSTTEQRRTEWMTFESLAESLDPDNPDRTVEGYPAPQRAAVIGIRPD